MRDAYETRRRFVRRFSDLALFDARYYRGEAWRKESPTLAERERMLSIPIKASRAALRYWRVLEIDSATNRER